jgi:hypothetical protein
LVLGPNRGCGWICILHIYNCVVTYEWGATCTPWFGGAKISLFTSDIFISVELLSSIQLALWPMGFNLNCTYLPNYIGEFKSWGDPVSILVSWSSLRYQVSITLQMVSSISWSCGKLGLDFLALNCYGTISSSHFQYVMCH